MNGVSAAGLLRRCAWPVVLSWLLVAQAQAFEAFDGRLQAHGFYEMQLRALNADYSEDWDASQWYNVFNLEVELDLLQDPIGVLDLLSAYVRAEVRYDCIYSRGCGMFRSMNAYGDRSKSLPRRLSNATSNQASGEIPIRNEGRVSGGTTDPVPLSEVEGFSALSETEGQPIPCGSGQIEDVDCFPDDRLGIEPFQYTFERFSDFRYSMVNVKGGSGSGNPVQILGPWLPSNNVATIATMADRVNPFDNSRLNPVLNCDFLDRIEECWFNGREPGNGARPFRPIPIYAEDRSRAAEQIEVVVYKATADLPPGQAFPDPASPSDYGTIVIDRVFNHGDARFGNGTDRTLFGTQTVMTGTEDLNGNGLIDPFPEDTNGNGMLDPGEDINFNNILDPSEDFNGNGVLDLPRRITGTAYDIRDLSTRDGSVSPSVNFANHISGDARVYAVVRDTDSRAGLPDCATVGPQTPCFQTIHGVSASKPEQARGLFLPSTPLREQIKKGGLTPSWPLNLTENERQWNRGLAQQDEKELKEAYLDIEMFDSQLWMRIGKQQIVWGKTELFRTTDQFNPQDLALATLPSLEESRVALWSARGIWSFYEQGPFEDVRLELAVNIDDYESSDFGSCGEPYTVNLVCSANFGGFAHGYTGVGIIGIEPPPDPWQSLKGWEIGGRVEWRWDRFSFALSDFWGYADLPSIRRVSTYERNVDPQTGRPLIYQGTDPQLRRINHRLSYARDASLSTALDGNGNRRPLWEGIGNEDDPWEDPYGDLAALIDEQQLASATPGREFDVRDGVIPGYRLTGAPGELPLDPHAARNPENFVARATRTNCGTTRPGSTQIRYNPRKAEGPTDSNADGQIPSWVRGADDCLTRGPTQLYTDAIRGQGRERSSRDLANPDCARLPNGQLPAGCTAAYDPTNALDAHHANLTIFNWICSATIGFVSIDPTACAPTVFGSTTAVNGIQVSEVIGRLLAGDSLLNELVVLDSAGTCIPNVYPATGILCDNPSVKGSGFVPFQLPIVQLSWDNGDLDSQARDDLTPGTFRTCQDFQTLFLVPNSQDTPVPCGGTQEPISYLGVTLSPEQEALLGCGPFWGTNCDLSGVDLLNMEPSVLLQSFAGASGTLRALDLKRRGISPPGTEIIDPGTGLVAPFRAPNEYRTDEGLQPGTLPWEALGIGGPICSTADIGGNPYPRGQDTITVPGANGPVTVARPPTRKEALPGCHRKWVDKQNGYLNLAWGMPEFQRVDLDGDGVAESLSEDPATGLPLQVRFGGSVVIDYAYYSGDPDPLGVKLSKNSFFPDSVQAHDYPNPNPNLDQIFSNQRPTIGPGHPFAGRRAVAPSGFGPGRNQLIVPFASELAGLSWNFQMIAVAFSDEFLNALETVGDLADPNRHSQPFLLPGENPNNPNLIGTSDPTLCQKQGAQCVPNPHYNAGARLEGGSIRNKFNINDRDTVASNRRNVAQLLFAYCGSEYGVLVDGQLGTGKCRVDPFQNEREPENPDVRHPLTELLLHENLIGINAQGKLFPRPNYFQNSQILFDSLQYPGARLVETGDPEDDDDQYEGTDTSVDPRFNLNARQNELVEDDDETQLFIKNEHCSFITPQYCSTVQNLFALAGLKRNTLNAGGNGTYGRRTMTWHSGGEITLAFPKRNVLGFALDFAEDRTKSNFSIETTWIENVPTGDANEWDNLRRTDEFNLTVSVDRPTFVNFLNPNRTLFINSQWFFQYRRGVKQGFGGNGPFNALATLTVFTGYFQDRLNPQLTLVHDIQSASGGLLPSINYRFSENFSATIGMAVFYGREQRADIASNGIGPASNEQGDWAYQTGAQNGISIVRDRDEVYMRLRYTF